MNHVELIGIAGSGKSTLASGLRSKNPGIRSLDDVSSAVTADLLFPGPSSQLASGLSTKTLSHLGRMSGVTDRGVNFFTITYPEMLKETSRHLRNATDDSERIHFVTGKVLDLVEMFGIVEEHATGGETVLIDEGFAFAAASIHHPPQVGRSFSESALRDYVSTLPVPDVVVFVRASPAVCEQRIHRRDDGAPPSFERLEVDSYLEILEEADRVSEAIAAAIESRGARIVEVNTEDRSVQESVVEVERALSVDASQ